MFPVNFVVGAAVGAAATYFYKDENANTWLKDTANKAKDGACSFVESFKKKPDDESAETVKESTDDATEVEATAETIEEDVASEETADKK